MNPAALLAVGFAVSGNHVFLNFIDTPMGINYDVNEITYQ